MKPDICIYHHPCPDGFTAAWAVWKRWPDLEFVGAKYGDTPPDVTGKHVLIVDFSYKRPVLEEMARSASTITILDHHKTAAEDLAPFAGGERMSWDWDMWHAYAGAPGVPNIRAEFDMERSGAMLAWQFCHGDAKVPALVGHVQDRDLWKFEIPGSRAVYQVQTSHPYDFQVWDDIANALEDHEGRAFILAEGAAIERKQAKMVDELLDQCTRHMIIGGHCVPVANLPYNMASDGAGKLAEGNRFAATYFDRADGRRAFSLRSDAHGLDVSAIASSYGGGGHARAAGFTAPMGWEGDAA